MSVPVASVASVSTVRPVASVITVRVVLLTLRLLVTMAAVRARLRGLSDRRRAHFQTFLGERYHFAPPPQNISNFDML